MTQNNQKAQEQLVNFAMKELTKIMQDVKQGKVAEMSSVMEKLSSELEMANEKRKSMSDEEVKQWAERIATEVSKLED